jgi:hypothetical protein
LGEDDEPNVVDNEVAQLNFDNPPNVAGFIANGLPPKAMLLRRGEANTDDPENCQQ